jgi:hypothetical protein
MMRWKIHKPTRGCDPAGPAQGPAAKTTTKAPARGQVSREPVRRGLASHEGRGLGDEPAGGFVELRASLIGGVVFRAGTLKSGQKGGRR